MSKTRSDNVLLNLPEPQQCKLAEWLLNGMPYHEANVLVGKEFGVELRSLSAYSAFWREVCEPALLARRSRMVESADARAAEVDMKPGQFDKATLDAIRERAYSLAISPQSEAKDVKAVLMLLLKAKDQELQERRITLLEAAAERAKRTEEVLESGVSGEEQAKRIREIFKK